MSLTNEFLLKKKKTNIYNFCLFFYTKIILINLHDWHGFWWNTSIWMNLFKNLVDIDWVGFFSSTSLFFFTFWSSCTFACFGNSFFWTFWGCLSFWRHNESVLIECTKEVRVDMKVFSSYFFTYIDQLNDNIYKPIGIEILSFSIGQLSCIDIQSIKRKRNDNNMFFLSFLYLLTIIHLWNECIDKISSNLLFYTHVYWSINWIAITKYIGNYFPKIFYWSLYMTTVYSFDHKTQYKK